MSSRVESEPLGTAGGGGVGKCARQPRSLAWRLTVWYTAAAFIIVASTIGFLYLVQVARFRQTDEEFLHEHVQIVRTLLLERPGDNSALQQQVELEAIEGIYIRVLDARENIVAETPEMATLLPDRLFPEPRRRGPEYERGFILQGADGKQFRAVVCAVPADTQALVTHWLQIAYNLSEELSLLAEFRLTTLPALLLAFVLCALCGHQIARRGLRPVHDIAQAMLQTRLSTLGERVQADRLPAELRELAVTFNGMLDRLQEAFERLSRFSADIAHELRTPINNLRGEVEVALSRSRGGDEYRDSLGSCLEESLRLSRILDSLLFLAQAENPVMKINRERLDLGAELSALKEYYDPAAAERGIALGVDVAADLTAHFDKVLLQRALGNLVDNALRHTPAGGSIQLLARRANGDLELGVQDSGCGIPAADLPRVFDRFYRTDLSRSSDTGGSGLGLAIVKSIAELHGGALVAQSQPGQGTRVWMKLPAAALDIKES